jgi:hypothetical protein
MVRRIYIKCFFAFKNHEKTVYIRWFFTFKNRRAWKIFLFQVNFGFLDDFLGFLSHI